MFIVMGSFAAIYACNLNYIKKEERLCNRDLNKEIAFRTTIRDIIVFVLKHKIQLSVQGYEMH